MKILLITARFSLSGVPLAQIRLALALARRGHEVKLIFCYVDPAYTLPSIDGLRVEVWNIPQARGALLPLVRELLIEKPDIVFSAEDHLNTWVLIAALLARSNTMISASSRVTPFDTYSDAPLSKRWALKQLAKLVMPRANVLTCVSKDMVGQYRQVFSNPSHVCIYNIVVDEIAHQRMNETVDHPWFAEQSFPMLLACGQLVHWKGFDDLIQAMALLRARREVRLMIIGDGPLRGDLQALIDARNLQDAVDLVGYVENPLKYFKRSDVFVLSSLVEGMPNVLVEAMMCGCTPVATDCPTGPRELLQEGRFGYLVPVRDPFAMASAIDHALDHPIPKDLLNEAVAPFEESQVIDRHFKLLGLC